MLVSLDDRWAEAVEDGTPTSWEELDELLGPPRAVQAGAVETELGRAGWYDSSAPPYPAPTTPVDAPEPAKPPVVEAVRHLWMARFNPGSPGWSDSDPDDDRYFSWPHPERAVARGEYWLSTTATPANAKAILELEIGDLVIVQRSDPKSLGRADLRGCHSGDVLIGVAIVTIIDEWDDIGTGDRERRVCLLPAAKFRYPVPRSTARRHGRIKGGSFQFMPQHRDGTGRLGFTLSAITVDQWSELLAVCGIHPDAMSEPDLAVLAARLRATAVGNKAYWKLRWDHVFRHAVRRRHEQEAIRRCRQWAAGRGLVFSQCAQYRPNAGYDLLFVDWQQKHVEAEVKGYMTATLAEVHLQRSQAARASSAATGASPDWWLFAALKVHTKKPHEHVRRASDVVALIASGGIQVR